MHATIGIITVVSCFGIMMYRATNEVKALKCKLGMIYYIALLITK